jgi:hypothetical protein
MENQIKKKRKERKSQRNNINNVKNNFLSRGEEKKAKSNKN